MHPQPLIRVAADVVLNNLRKQRGVSDHVGFAVGGADQFDGGIEPQAILLQTRVPDGEAGDDGGVSLQSYARDAARSACLDAEEVHEDAWLAIMLVSMRTPTVSPLRMAAIRP